ncbi:hypothetical protein CCR97_14890 [Rhodoplanes elegans]|uniref:Class III cytochrome C domain-containing protein n=2 Tax=Rhodoplanes elegans TaxID=29408 RepID=A0A327KTP2_9BRAD|nr:cytochrome c3 family protein [Rhodoplanes elegans]MBK5959484.1 hypothetical protein [Rhodoplanes elegans]RAI41406.1 hypothetical protein CH338_03295 [Rhodoplanes elegans]
MSHAMTRWLFGAAVMAVAATLTGPASAQTKGLPSADPETAAMVRRQNAECTACHSEAGLRALPRHDMDVKKLSGLLVDIAKFDTSIHAGMACRTCHTGGYREYPHVGAASGKAETLPCAECHAQKTFRIEPQVARSVHAKNLKDTFTCSSCHDSHVYQTAARLRDPALIVKQDNAMCIGCHGSDEKFAAAARPLPVPKKRPDLDAIHAWLPNTQRHWAAVRCVECHTPASTTRSLGLSHEVLNKDRAEQNCVTCHTKDTALRTRLYRWQAETEGARLGFVNSAIIGQAYVIGATRNTYFDYIGIALVVLALGGVALHGLGRVVAGLGRGGSK